MKTKTLLLIASVLVTSSLTFAQGSVDFENFSNSLVYTNSVHNGPATGLISGDHAYYFGLFSAPTNRTTVDLSVGGGWSFEDYATNTPTPGLLNGNYTTEPGVIVSYVPGETANFVVAGWSANIGTTWGAAQAWWNNGNPNSGPSGFFAISGIATDVVVGGSVFPVPTIFGPTPGYEIQALHTQSVHDSRTIHVSAGWSGCCGVVGTPSPQISFEPPLASHDYRQSL